MQKINNYISEKLHISKELKTKNPEPWANEKFEEPYNLLDWIVKKINNDCKVNTSVYDDSMEWDPIEYGYEDFDTTYGLGVDWVKPFKNEVSGTMIAIWEGIGVYDKLAKHPIIKFFKENYKENILYKQDSYYVKKWGENDSREYVKKGVAYVSVIEAISGESNEPLIAIIVTDY